MGAVTNHRSSPTDMVYTAYGGIEFENKIWDVARIVLEEWTGLTLKRANLYGVRVYQEGSILAPHVDRLPLVAAATINVAQDVDEDWPFEIYGHDGKAYNITMKPGDMVLYEIHSVIHGRPFPLKGRSYGNVFIHFEPIGHLDLTEEDLQDELPFYIVKGSTYERGWRQKHEEEKKLKRKKSPKKQKKIVKHEETKKLDGKENYIKLSQINTDLNATNKDRKLVKSDALKHQSKIEGGKYGIDLSWPIHHDKASNNYAWLPHNIDPKNHEVPRSLKDKPVQHFGDRQSLYEKTIQGCREFYGHEAYHCDEREKSRVELALMQPRSMHNYTDLGFKVMKAPADLMSLIYELYEQNLHRASPETWLKGNAVTNHWSSPTDMVYTAYGGIEFENKIWDVARIVLEEWTGLTLKRANLY